MISDRRLPGQRRMTESPPTADPFELQREAMRREFFGKLFLLGGFIGATDTYKRTMWAAVPDIAVQPASYTLTMRRGLPEPGAANHLIMAGHEAMLAQWFHRPLRRRDIELSRRWFHERSAVRAFPDAVWDAILGDQPGDEIDLPINVWGFPGGQSFLPGVPCVVFEGMGGAVSYLEPAMCRYYAPILQATKARLMKAATPRDAEFGLRSAPDEATHIILLLARYVGSGGTGQLTSNDTAEFLWPDLFRTVGTIGHEMMSAAQGPGKTLGDAERDMMDRFVASMGQASLLTDLVDAESVGLENALRVMREHPENDRVGVRIDSGDIASQCVLYFQRMQAAGITPRMIVFENEVTPEVVREVYDEFRKATGREPTMLFPGAGGYWWRAVHRDTVAAAFKRSATGDQPNVKFSNSPGKESLGGYLRVYADRDALIVADANEPPPGEPLFVKLVERGRIVYDESFQDQAARADRTWGRYRRWVLAPRVAETMRRFREMRESEVAAARARLAVQ
jgi:nicotinic acid phosphoribosyltransferase